ncbi:50S ribosomal protein L23 [bacterium]|jgi:large subunit ribosomal protein L23|nr:50S ribosomal protein L23 [bacterium]NBX78740.1 50S ribosomal protein L23 [bacterium]
MELSIYDIIQSPVITDKAYRLSTTLQQVTFQVHPAANKPLVARAIEKLFDVKVQAVRIAVRKGKFKKNRARRSLSQDNLRKRAIVTLKEGHTLNFFADFATQSQAAQNEQVAR